MKNPDLKVGILKTRSEYAQQGSWKRKFTVIKINCLDCNVVHNGFSAILERELTACCHAEWPDGHCTTQ